MSDAIASPPPIRVLLHANGWAVNHRGRCRVYFSREYAIRAAQTFGTRDRCDVVVHDQHGDIERVLAFEGASGALTRARWKRKGQKTSALAA
ncbi:MAG: hypothetical protein JWN99_205 [Ilumatobacteraceae bacterium]|nr:hypothetical protein [Ilumatobacteraceae bacterium]